MQFIQWGIPTFGVIVALLGVLEFNKGYVDWSVKFFNSARGVKTQITQTTYKAHKIAGIYMIVVSIGLIAFSYFLSNFLLPYL